MCCGRHRGIERYCICRIFTACFCISRLERFLSSHLPHELWIGLPQRSQFAWRETVWHKSIGLTGYFPFFAFLSRYGTLHISVMSIMDDVMQMSSRSCCSGCNSTTSAGLAVAVQGIIWEPPPSRTLQETSAHRATFSKYQRPTLFLKRGPLTMSRRI